MNGTQTSNNKEHSLQEGYLVLIPLAQTPDRAIKIYSCDSLRANGTNSDSGTLTRRLSSGGLVGRSDYIPY